MAYNIPQDIWSTFMEENPDILYRTMQPKKGSTSFMDYWSNNYGKVWNQFLGTMSPQNPNPSFGGYLGTYPWLQNWYNQSPYQRGERPSAFSPQLRWQV